MFLFEQPEQLEVLDEEHLHPARHDLHQRQQSASSTSKKTPSRSRSQPRGPDEDDSQFVLEVPGGWARAHGVERGVAVKFVDID